MDTKFCCTHKMDYFVCLLQVHVTFYQASFQVMKYQDANLDTVGIYHGDDKVRFFYYIVHSACARGAPVFVVDTCFF